MIHARIRIQFVSDIHLEMIHHTVLGPYDILMPGDAEYLALCGDIGYPEDALLEEFIRYCSRNYRMVFWVPGNHEFYSTTASRSPMTIQEKYKKMEALSRKFTNVMIMDQTGFNVSGTPIRIIGCTLWTHIPQEFALQAAKYMNDYRVIYKNRDERFTVEDANEWHRRDKAWIQSEIQAAEQSGQELVVLTHHLPTQRLVHQKYEGHPLNVCFATSLDSMMRFPVRAWLCGHSHTANEARVNGVLCALNPGGYPGENESSLDRRKILTVVVKDEDEEYKFENDTYITGMYDGDTSSDSD